MFDFLSTVDKVGSAQPPRTLIRGDASMLAQFHGDMQEGPAGKNLQVRTTGKFYTPEVITTELIEQVLSSFSLRSNLPVRVVDPFCGDGRLVVELVRKLSAREKRIRWDIELWDCDPKAITSAAASVRHSIEQTGGKGKAIGRAVDSFEHAKGAFNTFDIVVTNPPWETVKPDRRELAYLPASRRTSYTQALRKRDDLLADWFPVSQPNKKFSGWGTNLARVGTEVALRLSRTDGGVCGLVSPASLLGDQVSRKLREWMFSGFNLRRLSFFPAEGRFFESVDQPIIALTMCAGSKAQGDTRSQFRVFDKWGALVDIRRLDTTRSTLQSTHYTIPIQFGPNAVDALANLRGLPVFGSLEGPDTKDLWAGRELDETSRERYLASRGTIRFAKGEMVTRYATRAMPQVFVDPTAIKIPVSAGHRKIGWRDVSRPTQKRRMQASIIPKNWVTGNSLHVAYFRDDDHERLLALLVTLNSLVCEFQIRARLATAHVSLGVVRQSHLPELTAPTLIATLASLARRCLAGDSQAQLKAEVMVAKAYGLNRDSFGQILEMFPKLEAGEKDSMLAPYAWSHKRKSVKRSG